MSIILDKIILCSKYNKRVSIKNNCKNCKYYDKLIFDKTIDNFKELIYFECIFAIELLEVKII